MPAKQKPTPDRFGPGVQVRMTDDMRDAFKEYCDKRGTNMAEAVRKYIQRTLDRQK